MEFRSPRLTVDGLVVKNRSVLLVKRKNEPFKGKWALPGGFVNYGEKVEDAVIREVKEETGIETSLLELFGVYSDPDRDPRGHTVTIVFVLKPCSDKIKGGSDAADARYFPLENLPELAFDHRKIIEDYRRKAGI